MARRRLWKTNAHREMNAHGDKREVLYEGRWLRLVRERDWEFIEHRAVRGIAVIIAITQEQCLLLVEQERIPLGRRVIELPAGLVGDGPERQDEGFAEAARRELLEESGYLAKQMRLLFSGPMSPARTSDQYSFFLAEDLTKTGPGGGDDTEDIVVHSVPLAIIHGWLREKHEQGFVIDPKIYTSLYFVEHPDSVLEGDRR